MPSKNLRQFLIKQLNNIKGYISGNFSNILFLHVQHEGNVNNSSSCTHCSNFSLVKIIMININLIKCQYKVHSFLKRVKIENWENIKMLSRSLSSQHLNKLSSKLCKIFKFNCFMSAMPRIIPREDQDHFYL